MVLDKGSVELLGPFGLEKGLLFLSRKISNLSTGLITNYALYILIGLILYLSLPSLALYDFSLFILSLLGLYTVVYYKLDDLSLLLRRGQSRRQDDRKQDIFNHSFTSFWYLSYLKLINFMNSNRISRLLLNFLIFFFVFCYFSFGLVYAMPEGDGLTEREYWGVQLDYTHEVIANPATSPADRAQAQEELRDCQRNVHTSIGDEIKKKANSGESSQNTSATASTSTSTSSSTSANTTGTKRKPTEDISSLHTKRQGYEE